MIFVLAALPAIALRVTSRSIGLPAAAAKRLGVTNDPKADPPRPSRFFHTARPLALAVVVVAIFVGASPFAAEESYVLTIEARLIEPPSLITKNVVKHPLEMISQEEVDSLYFANTGVEPSEQFDCQQADTNPPILVPIETCVWWVLRINVTNLFENPISNVMVTDHFSAELDGEPLDSMPVHVEEITHTAGQAGKKVFTTQVRILWCVTGNLGEEAEECVKKGDDRDLLGAGETATLDVLVFTKLNPSGRQEYTSPCDKTMEKDLCYELNSGATAKWIDTKTGSQMSASTEPIKVGTLQTASVAEDQSNPTPTAAATATDAACLPVLVDFAAASAGEPLTDQYAVDGVHISGIASNGIEQVIVFDSWAQDTPDPGLEVDVGNLAILPDNVTDTDPADGLVDVPNDTGGTQSYAFDYDRLIISFVFVNPDPSQQVSVQFFDLGGVLLGTLVIAAPESGGPQLVKPNVGGVRRMEISYETGSGITDIDLGCGGQTAESAPTSQETDDTLLDFLVEQPEDVLNDFHVITTPTPTPTHTPTPEATTPAEVTETPQ